MMTARQLLKASIQANVMHQKSHPMPVTLLMQHPVQRHMRSRGGSSSSSSSNAGGTSQLLPQ
jgi:hypothetical protein